MIDNNEQFRNSQKRTGNPDNDRIIRQDSNANPADTDNQNNSLEQTISKPSDNKKVADQSQPDKS